jgi:nickel-dependent lactate racemase
VAGDQVSHGVARSTRRQRDNRDVTTTTLAYGRTGLMIDLPTEQTVVVEPTYARAADDQRLEVTRALRQPVAGPPLREILRPGAKVVISMCDGTRAQPRHIVIPALLEAFDGIIRLEDVVILVATGTHRGNSAAEIRAMVGDEVADTVTIVNHDARDDGSLVYLGRHGKGVPVWLNRIWVEADLRITTGFVEPHFFAGFSGGPKMVAPGLAGLDTVLTLHNAQRIGDPRATWGICEGNPVHDDVRAVVGAVGAVDFAIDVVLNRDQQIVKAFGGPVLEMHAVARELTRELSMRPVPSLFDVVVTTGSGFPLDQNLYQAVKGMTAAASVVRPGGTIVCAAECRDGFPDHGSYREVLASADSPRALLEAISSRTETIPDQWQVQIQARVQDYARVVMHTSYLSDQALATAHLEQTDDIARTVREALAAAGPSAKVCVLPEGPQTVPYLLDAR